MLLLNSIDVYSVQCNPFTPEFMKWTLPSLTLDTFFVANRGLKNRMVNSVAPDETVLDLHVLQGYVCWSAGLKRLNT